MSGTECIINEYISDRSKILRESISVLGLFCSETGILEKDNITVFHSCYSCANVLANNFRISNELHFLAKELGKTYCYRSKSLGELIFFGLNLAEMGAKDNLAAVCDQLLDGRKCCNQSVLIGDLTGDDGNVEIATAENSLTLYVDVINCFLI